MYIITLIILYVIYECDEVNQQIITWKLDGYSKIEILKKWLRIFFWGANIEALWSDPHKNRDGNKSYLL